MELGTISARRIIMRQRNWRLVIVGIFFIVIGFAIFIFVPSLGAYSTDPVEFTRLIGQIAQFVIGISVAMIIFGLIGTKPKQ
jgi:hypothetical protein